MIRWPRPRSLQAALALRLGLLFLVVTAVAVITLAWLGAATATALSRQDLFRVADELAEGVGRNGVVERGVAALRTRGLLNEGTLYAVRDEQRRLLGASSPAVGELALSRPAPGRRNRSFQLAAFGSPPLGYHGVEVRERSDFGTLFVLVAEPLNEQDALLNALLGAMAWQAAWIIPMFIGLTLLVGVYAIRSGLRPLRDTLAQAARIHPQTLSQRLCAQHLPGEVRPFVHAVNGVLDRLEAGFELQRRFTANAAHELRTPLAIITSALDTLPPGDALTALRIDVARMNRLVEQLLHVARLDSLALDTSATVDLNTCARNVVTYMAPMAIEQARMLAFDGSAGPVLVGGNVHAIEDAIRNLVENALTHTPEHSEVRVRVYDKGWVCVDDAGPGIAPQDRARMFERFWRGEGARSVGSGLGLAIVREIMLQHGGAVEVAVSPGGGSRFVLQFNRVPGERNAGLSRS